MFKLKGNNLWMQNNEAINNINKLRTSMKTLLTATILFFALNIFAQNDQTLYDFVVEDIQGNTFEFSQLKGKKVLIVNTASKCGLTPQYDDLEELYQKYLELVKNQYPNFIIGGRLGCYKYWDMDKVISNALNLKI